MIYPYGNLRANPPFSDTTVDNIIDQDGVIDQFAPISLEIKDKKLIENINQRIADSRSYYNDENGFNLDSKRAENLAMYLGIQANSDDFYEGEEPYIENQIRRAVDSIVSYATARTPQSTVTPADSTPQAKKFASNLEKAHLLHSTEFDLRGIIEVAVRSWMLNQAAYVLLEFDPSHGKDGEIVPRIIPVDELVVDKNARFGDNPEFIAIYEKHTIEELVFLFPEKKKEIYESVSIKRPGPKNVTQEVVTRKVWFTYYDKDNTPQEAVAIYYDETMLGKYRDINWLEGRQNFLNAPVKPIIPLNVINDGKHWVDFSTPLDDGIRMQKLLNQRGKQISRNAAKSNGTVVVDGKKSGLTKEDVENWTGTENQKIYLKKAKDGVALDKMIMNLEGKDLKPFVVQEKQDMRNQLGELMGVPVDQTGADATSDDPTLGQALIKKNNDNSRQDMIVRAIDRFLYKYFNLLTQMMFVWYDEDHFFPYLDSDGTFERIVIKRYYFDDGMRVSVRGSSTIAFDKNREQAMALKFLDRGNIALVDAYRIAGFDNPQKLYDNWVKQQKDPYELVRDANDAFDDGNAYAEFIDFMNGKHVRKQSNPSKDFILTLRKLMMDDKFMEAKPRDQAAFIKRYNEYLDNFEMKESLDQLGQQDLATVPQPGQPIPPVQPPQPPIPPGGMPPQMGQPGAVPPPMMPPGAMGGQSMLPGGLPPMGQPPGMGGGPGIFGGTPFVNPQNPQTPSGISAIPIM